LFEIGSSLREKRLLLKLELVDVERETRIRSRYLAALEADEFDRLPGEAYVKAFLRTYAQFLGLDGDLFVHEYSGGRGEAEPPPLTPTREPTPRSWRLNRAAVVGGAVAIAVLAIIAWGGRGSHRTPPAPTRHAVSAPRPRPLGMDAPPLVASLAAAAPAAKPQTPRVSIVAAGGNCWVSAHAGSATGPLLYEGTLPRGASLSFRRPRLWVRLGAPASVVVKLNGRIVGNLPKDTASVVLTAVGAHVV
jgi:hypothetical protein